MLRQATAPHTSSCRAKAASTACSGDPTRLVSDRALLITPKNVGMTPTLSEQRVEARIRRVRKLLGEKGAARLGELVNRQAAGWGGNVALGTLLGMTPELSLFVGVALDTGWWSP